MANYHQDDDEDKRDDLDELIAEITKQNPDFPALLEKARKERIAVRARGGPQRYPLGGRRGSKGGTATSLPAVPQQS
jgi:hypothetical protein